MTEIVIITHGLFGEELFLSAELILGKQGDVHNISVQPGDSLAEVADNLDVIINKNNGKGILILTDMFGGSPSNVAFSYSGRSDVEIISGINLPMLIKAFAGRMAGYSLYKLASECAEAAKNCIKIASELLKKSCD